ncbi:MAG: carbohydrate ABC transporter permease, partial [Sphaerochaetaceae bacterium]
MATLTRKKHNKWNTVVNIVLIVLVIIWSIPIIGLLISSVRPQDDVLNTGWWTIFTGEDNGFTLNNYKRVLGGSQATFTDAEGNVLRASGDNLSQAFINSFTVTIPSVIIPILIAAAAAFGFAWMVFP